jgi:hypothetical protein
MGRSFAIDKKIYSVDMMFAYVNILKHPITEVKISDYEHFFNFQTWGDIRVNKLYSPFDVLNNMQDKKYKNDIARIKKANLKYPVFVYNGYIVDGMHRLVKAKLLKKKTIKAYVFDDKLMAKFLLNNKGNWKKVDSLETYEFIELFIKRFIKKN